MGTVKTIAHLNNLLGRMTRATCRKTQRDMERTAAAILKTLIARHGVRHVAFEAPGIFDWTLCVKVFRQHAGEQAEDLETLALSEAMGDALGIG